MFNTQTMLSTRSILMKIIAVSAIMTLFCVYVFDVSNGHFFADDRIISADWNAIRSHQEATWDPAYYVKTNGCRMPSYPLMDERTKIYFEHALDPIVCAAMLTVANDTHVWVPHSPKKLRKVFAISDPESIICSVDAIRRISDTANEEDTSERQFFKYGQAVAAQTEFVLVTCTYYADSKLRMANESATSGQISEMVMGYHYFVAPKFGTDNNTSKKSDKISVMMIGIDSVSRLNFHRMMKQTASLLKQLNAIELYGYNKIEDNTYPNVMAILTGLELDELTATCLSDAKPTYDGCNFIWDLYKERGYNTVFAEDWSFAGLFNFGRPGFSTQPTDLRLRPIIIEMEAQASSQKDNNAFMCLSGERTVDVLLNYIGMFVRSVGWLPYFSMFWTSTYTHDYLSRPQIIDKEVASMIVNITSSKTFKNTFLFVMSDHGMRYGSYRNIYQGSMEDRQPLMLLIPPKWFNKRYPQATLNLMANRRSLTTPFDIYETLRDLLEPHRLATKQLQKRDTDLVHTDPMPRGISLFMPVPVNRSCATAAISPHWCTCHEKLSIAIDDHRVQRAARYVVQQINHWLAKFEKCQQLALSSIFDAYIVTTSRHFIDVRIQFQATPGQAEFEANCRVHDDGHMEVQAGSVSRTNLYGDQNACVHNFTMLLYCVCKNKN